MHFLRPDSKGLRCNLCHLCVQTLSHFDTAVADQHGPISIYHHKRPYLVEHIHRKVHAVCKTQAICEKGSRDHAQTVCVLTHSRHNRQTALRPTVRAIESIHSSPALCIVSLGERLVPDPGEVRVRYDLAILQSTSDLSEKA